MAAGASIGEARPEQHGEARGERHCVANPRVRGAEGVRPDRRDRATLGAGQAHRGKSADGDASLEQIWFDSFG